MWEKGRIKTMSNILLLEDDLSLINGLSFALRKQGYELEVARTIKEVDAKKSVKLQKCPLFF